MTRHKAPGLSWLIAEMKQAKANTGTQWILENLLSGCGLKFAYLVNILCIA